MDDIEESVHAVFKRLRYSVHYSYSAKAIGSDEHEGLIETLKDLEGLLIRLKREADNKGDLNEVV